MELTALETATAVRAGSLTAREATTRALDRIARSQPVTNAWQVVRAEAALAEADAVDRHPDRSTLPLAGVPMAIKDTVPVAGEPLRDGSLATNPTPRAADHEVVRRLRRAGAVVVGLTRVPELCVWGVTDSRFGITRNPWDTERTPGGSSGGSAAAVAAGDVPIAHGNDGMGSIRIPAACCGLVGLKPGTGLVPTDDRTSHWNGMSEHGPLSTTVPDAALMLSVLADDPHLAAVGAPGDLRIALSTRAPAPLTPVAAPWQVATRRVARLLQEAGHRVTEQTPRYSPTLLTTTGLALWTTGTAEEADLVEEPDRLEARTRRHAAIGRALARRGHPRPVRREAWRSRAEEFFGDVDVLLTPALAQPPVPAEAWSSRGWLRSMVANARFAPFAAPWNIVGWPAMTVPAGLDPAGRPVAVQLVGRPGTEAMLLALAGQLEALQPWPRTASMA
jgi:amidase